MSAATRLLSRTASADRVRTLLTALGAQPDPSASRDDLLEQLARDLQPIQADTMWLSLAVLGAALPEVPDVQRAVRRARLDGPLAALGHVLPRGGWAQLLGQDSLARVEVTDGVLVDVEHTSRTALATGVQRVARQTTARWARDHEILLVGWTKDRRALRPLSAAQAHQALTGASIQESAPDGARVVVVPWQGTFVLPELALEADRTRRLMALARWSRSRTAVIGFDCVPISASETTGLGVSEGFANNLAAVRHFDVVCAISEAAAQEYKGWRTMLAGIGLDGPSVRAVDLPVEATTPSENDLAEARRRLCLPGVPLVLCVGSHEPRKNHLALLHAAEVLWRRGLLFSLVFIGGNAWNSERFEKSVAQGRAAGRPVETISKLSDGMLWASYQLARCVAFPSLSEGFGLPVAESLAAGTPVLTSNYGSMAEIVRDGGGGVLIDPRDDADIVDGLYRLLTDDALHARLSAEAAARPRRTWDEYAEQAWATMVGQGPAA